MCGVELQHMSVTYNEGKRERDINIDKIAYEALPQSSYSLLALIQQYIIYYTEDRGSETVGKILAL